MSVNNNLLREFVKITNDNDKKKPMENIYGTIVVRDGKNYVKMDGSDIATPIRATTEVKENERVIVNIKNHMAVVTGNLSDPSAGGNRVDGLADQNGYFEHLFAGNITADNIQAGAITADKILAGSVTADKILADQIKSNHIEANSIKAKHIEAGAITADKIEAGAINADKIAAGTIIAGSGIISDGAIGNAQISNLEASKLSAGTIDTTDIIIAGANSNLRLKGNRLQVFAGIGAEQVERVSIGDVNADGTVYGLRVRGADGKTVLLDENGVTSQGITDGSITNDKINPNANIDGGKLNIGTVIDKINEDGSRTINSVKIDVDGKALGVVVKEINDKSTEQDKNIQTNTSSINANANAIKLKVDEQTYKEDTDAMKTVMEKNTADIVVVKEGISLSATKTEVINQIKESEDKTQTLVTESIKTHDAALDVKFDSINLKVSDLTSDVNGLEGSVAAIDIKADGIIQSVKNLDGRVASIDVKADGIIQSVTAVDGRVTEVNVKADGISQRVTGLDGKYTELKQTVDGIDITGMVTFNDLSNNNNYTEIHGGNIKTNSLTADKIEGRHLYGVSVTTQEYGSRAILTGDGINFNDSGTPAGKLSYDSTGNGANEARDRLWLRSLGGYALKIQSSGDMSVSANEGYNNIYMKAGQYRLEGRFFINNKEITGNGGVAVFG